jgi:hypothetical protein
MAPLRIAFLSGLALTAGLSAARISVAADAPAAHPSHAAGCFAQHPPTVVVPYESDQVAGDGSYTSVVGAQLFVPAEKGLTAEWLNYQYRERLAHRQSSGDCPLDLPGLNVSVQSAGPGFWVQLSASDENTAREVLRRSRLWVPSRDDR